MPPVRPAYEAAIATATTAVLAHLASPSPGRQFGHLMTACGFQKGQVLDCDGHAVAADRVLNRALNNLSRNGKIESLSDRAWHLTGRGSP